MRVIIEKQVAPKAKMVPHIPVASIVASATTSWAFSRSPSCCPCRASNSSARCRKKCSR
ncbi:hypothetical protein BURKHO8Y_120038 [Burkholderia sp. 8Y]|nr:hypothetical protein BURKHO8Y_120038 [Burkholderia sp. 8Y]